MFDIPLNSKKQKKEKQKVTPVQYFEFSGSKSGEIDSKMIYPLREENMSDMGHFLVVKWQQI